MTSTPRVLSMAATGLVVLLLGNQHGIAQDADRSPAQPSGFLSIRSADGRLRATEQFIVQRERAGDLVTRSTGRDPLMPARVLERLQQFHQGIPVWGAEVVRDSERGVPVSLIGELVTNLPASVVPTLAAAAADARLTQLAGGDGAVLKQAELVVVPLGSGTTRLTYTGVIAPGDGVWRVFIDATTGAEVLRTSEIHTQSAVGTGRGVLGDTKKLAVRQQTGAFWTADQLRPPVLETYDLRFQLTRASNVVERGAALTASDLATDTDNLWTDPSVIDAHVHSGWTYDFLFKRFGRRGLDNGDRPITVLTNAMSQQAAVTASGNVLMTWALNAFWCNVCGPGGRGVMVFGNGIPSGFTFRGQNWTYVAGALDVVAHELAHAVTSSSSGLVYQNESGALNEAFSDILGTAAEFHYQPAGTGVMQADYTIGEDVVRGLAVGAPHGVRSLSNPALFGDPDHYSRRYVGPDDSGGVHINSGIANQAFYLAIEGGVNRTSGLSVQGVGAANRVQIENVFYRAFVFLLPANATFSTARAATIQTARDLYGNGSATERAVVQAWTAVGVQ